MSATPLALGPLDARADHLAVPMRDGVRLATDVYLPPGAGPFPTVLTRLPYDKCAREAYVPWVAAYMTHRGYAFVAQDVRGKLRSEGETHAFVAELADGWDTLEWVSSQPWSTGAIGMWGESYYGVTQWAAAASGHPALRAIVPRNTTARIGQDWLWRQGVAKLGMPAAWAADTWVDASLYGVTPAAIDWSARPLTELVGTVHGGRRAASFDAWCASTPAVARAWTASLFGGTDPARGLRVAALHVGGWFDLFRRGQLADWATARATSPAPQLLVMDATDHVQCEWTLRPPGLVDLHTMPDAAIEDFLPRYLDDTLAFYDRLLRDGDGPALPAVRWRLTGGGWQQSDRWPPEGARPLTLHLVAAERALADEHGGALTADADRVAAWVRWTHDPHDPVPSVTADELQPLAAPPDDRTVQARDDVATFTSKPFTVGLTLAGPLAAEILAGTSAPSSHTMVKLVDVAPGGATRRISEGAALVAGEQRIVVGLGDTGYRLAPGHRLRLEVAASSFPQHPPHPGTDQNPLTATAVRSSEQRLRVGGSDGSRLRLTVLPAA